MFDSKVVTKYILIHLSELVIVVLALILIRQFVGMPTWLFATAIALWIIKDVVLFFKVWRAYAYGDNSPTKELVGLEATVMDGLDPLGYVRVRGELWKAEVSNPGFSAARGDRTRVVDVNGMTLVVERCDDRGGSRSADAVP